MRGVESVFDDPEDSDDVVFGGGAAETGVHPVPEEVDDVGPPVEHPPFHGSDVVEHGSRVVVGPVSEHRRVE